MHTWPWWNLTGGSRHSIIHTGDLGVEESGVSWRHLTSNLTWLTHWGLYNDKTECCGWRAAHRPGKDVVIPVYISAGHFRKFGFHKSPLHPGYTQPPQRSTSFFFAGRICGDRKDPDIGVWPNCRGIGEDYSANVRQKVHYFHHNRTGYLIQPRTHSYEQRLRSSQFCLAPLGGGHGQRQIIVGLMGCIPVTIGDFVHQPFEPQLDWSAFSVAVDEAHIPTLHDRLSSIVAGDQFASMQKALACAAQHLVYSSITGGFLGDEGKYDAFETTLEVLRAMHDHPDVPPEKLQDVDPEFRMFMHCGGVTEGGTATEPQLAGRDEDTEEVQSPSPQLLSSTPLDLRLRSPAKLVANYSYGLCSHSFIDEQQGGIRPSCSDCLMGSSNTHGIPGGAACCGSRGRLERCYRSWH
ncbi:hypothetical protein CEUSTIGMA_g5452.t1 [Chlamydomonas eustigma]|uniref:Exostosin GT47 domain-containing protein n=1 Tax=Chlamydomonas eustigma TaxID=1157962 RepID=A0A250X5H6_9CHLO|nr:hypothetical protein CEUSTIGMA_g5452.t1 [Chlamydomonas eustigma]|eukprot:GAX78010.1 hypothetical protein CEUSTIGMA_g5452.t1 [Chlamydomonas eustigma]